MPLWAVRLLETGQEPQEGEPGYDQWFGWSLCGESVSGLPRRLTAEDQLAWRRMQRAARR
jgi:hypothetical protein